MVGLRLHTVDRKQLCKALVGAKVGVGRSTTLQPGTSMGRYCQHARRGTRLVRCGHARVPLWWGAIRRDSGNTHKEYTVDSGKSGFEFWG